MIKTKPRAIERLAIGQSLNCSITQSHLKAAGKDWGFTLIEMLVVMLIMGLLVGLVSTITRPDDRALLRVEAERLAQLLDLAAAESRLTGKPIAWTTDGRDYQFWRFEENTGWSEIVDVDTLRARTLPQGITISGLQIENMRQNIMRLEFTPYGSMLAFNVDLSLGAERRTIAGSPVGDVRVLSAAGPTHDAMALRQEFAGLGATNS